MRHVLGHVLLVALLAPDAVALGVELSALVASSPVARVGHATPGMLERDAGLGVEDFLAHYSTTLSIVQPELLTRIMDSRPTRMVTLTIPLGGP